MQHDKANLERIIDPKVWEMMLAVPGWTPPSEALILRAIMEGRARVIWAQYNIQVPETGFAMLRVGDPNETDTDDAIESMTWMAEPKLNGCAPGLLLKLMEIGPNEAIDRSL